MTKAGVCVDLHLDLHPFRGIAPLCRVESGGCSWHCAKLVHAQGDVSAGLQTVGQVCY